MTLPARMKFGIFMAPFHPLGEDPTLAIDRDLELMQWLDYLGFDEAWIGEHHSAGWETIASPEIFIATAAERTKNLKFGTGVISLPYHHPLMVANRMILLDHLTKGRAMLGVGPGALGSDAYMLGIDALTQRRRMDESLGIIMRLFTETEPITYQSDWFELHEAMAHLRPYTYPHMPIAVAAAQSPSGMQLAGKHGAGILSVSVIRDAGTAPNLAKYWQIAEEVAASMVTPCIVKTGVWWCMCFWRKAVKKPWNRRASRPGAISASILSRPSACRLPSTARLTTSSMPW